jgi:hypothetical protein
MKLVVNHPAILPRRPKPDFVSIALHGLTPILDRHCLAIAAVGTIVAATS